MNQLRLQPVSEEISLEEIFEAYFCCRANKRYTSNALAFEVDYERHLVDLWREINEGNYQVGRSIAFIIDKPVIREIFAADFRDRVVHHLIINKLNPLFERKFIYDSYGCRPGKGTLFGINRINQFIRRCSRNYTSECFVMKLDIQGFFMNINKGILETKLIDFIDLNYRLPDCQIITQLCSRIIANDPTKNCIIKGRKSDWELLPASKSLFGTPSDCGLPIGNLTSQIFANFYLDTFDHFIKHNLKIRFYGRYVDDFIIVHEEKDFIKDLLPQLAGFLRNELQLNLHPKKIYLQSYEKGVPFLGAFIKPHRIYIGKRTKGNLYRAILKQNQIAEDHKPIPAEQKTFQSCINSYLGLLRHYATFRLRRNFLKKYLSCYWWNLAYSSGGYQKLVMKKRKFRDKDRGLL